MSEVAFIETVNLSTIHRLLSVVLVAYLLYVIFQLIWLFIIDSLIFMGHVIRHIKGDIAYRKIIHLKRECLAYYVLW